MDTSDREILKKIKQLFQSVRDDERLKIHGELTNLYSQLSYSHPYAPQELFPTVDVDYHPSERAIEFAQKLSKNAQQKWNTDLSGNGSAYFSCREGFRQRTGIDIGRNYIYPNNLSSQAFQESFSPTVLPKMISVAYGEMATAACLLGLDGTSSSVYDRAFGFKFFLGKEKPVAMVLVENAYRAFWRANSGISGYENLKNIKNFDDKRNFLMGVASEIPLDDVAAYVFGDEKIADEIQKNNERFKKAFHTKDNITFSMTNKTWNKYVQPVLHQRKKVSNKGKVNITSRLRKCAEKRKLEGVVIKRNRKTQS